MPTVQQHAPGAPAWVELCTNDLSGAIAFYERLFGWNALEMPAEGPGAFVMLRRNGVDVAATYALGAMHSDKGIPAHWLIYFASADVDETLAKIRAAQGGVLFGPFDVGPQGRSAICVDRHGAMFGVWQAIGHIGSGIVDEPGTLSWPELASPDVVASKEFYAQVFGWGAKESEMDAGGYKMTYTEWLVGAKAVGGCLQMTEEWKGIPPHWMPYFQVESCAAACEQIAALGGTVKYGPLPIPNVGLFAVALDPQGVVFTVIELATMPSLSEMQRSA